MHLDHLQTAQTQHPYVLVQWVLSLCRLQDPHVEPPASHNIEIVIDTHDLAKYLLFFPFIPLAPYLLE
jgi:hypothetical protein